MMLGTMTYGQSLFSPRAVALGGYGAVVEDVRGFDHNPAGLTSIRDWDFTSAAYAFSSNNSKDMVFQGLAFGKRFLDRHALAVQYSPGSTIAFLVPTSVLLLDSTPVSIDQRISYDEVFSIGYGVRALDGFSMGIGGRLIGEKVTDTEYQLVDDDSISYITSTDQEVEASSWQIDLGLMWLPTENITLSLVGRNLTSVGKDLPESFKHLSLSRATGVELGASYLFHETVRATGEISSLKTGAVGIEVLPVKHVALRAGLYFDRNSTQTVSAVAAGLGWSFEFLDIDMGYIHFTDQSNRSGRTDLAAFDPSEISRVDLNPFTRDRVALSVKAVFGATQESLVRIESVEMLGGIYPSASEVFAYRPVGKVRVRNISNKPVYSKASFMVDRYMDAPTETEPVYLAPGEEREIPFTALFNEHVRSVSSMVIREGTVYVNATPAEQYDDKVQTKILIYGKNDWDGDVQSLRYFVTPNDPEIVGYARDILLEFKDSLDAVPGPLQQFQKARVMCQAFAGKLLYVGDPKQSTDLVQYPSETIKSRSGDCDDMTVCFSSLLNSIGISTSFVDVAAPERPQDGHIYLLFDTGVDPRYGASISENPKRYVVRKNQSGNATIWIPVETTAITRGFDEAWSAGAQEYFDDVEVGLGLIKGWVRIVDVY
ncbi:MAG: hypothetical protein ACKVRP_05530 [Bacteroidota bacterium]